MADSDKRKRQLRKQQPYRSVAHGASLEAAALAKKRLKQMVEEMPRDPLRPLTQEEAISELYEQIEYSYKKRHSWHAIARAMKESGVSICGATLEIKFGIEKKRRENDAKALAEKQMAMRSGKVSGDGRSRDAAVKKRIPMEDHQAVSPSGVAVGHDRDDRKAVAKALLQNRPSEADANRDVVQGLPDTVALARSDESSSVEKINLSSNLVRNKEWESPTPTGSRNIVKLRDKL